MRGGGEEGVRTTSTQLIGSLLVTPTRYPPPLISLASFFCLFTSSPQRILDSYT